MLVAYSELHVGRGGWTESASSRNAAVLGNKRQLSLAWRKQVVFWICCVFLPLKAGQGTGMGRAWGTDQAPRAPVDPPWGCSPHPSITLTNWLKSCAIPWQACLCCSVPSDLPAFWGFFFAQKSAPANAAVTWLDSTLVKFNVVAWYLNIYQAVES